MKFKDLQQELDNVVVGKSLTNGVALIETILKKETVGSKYSISIVQDRGYKTIYHIGIEDVDKSHFGIFNIVIRTQRDGTIKSATARFSSCWLESDIKSVFDKCYIKLKDWVRYGEY